MARITLWGFYQYDPTLFDGATLPDGMDKDGFLSRLMRKVGNLYPYHQHPVYLKEGITEWFGERLYGFTRMRDGLLSDYDPIENYKRQEEISRHHADGGKDGVVSNSDTESTYTPDLYTSNETQVSAFDSSQYQPREKNSTSQSGRSITHDHGETNGTTTYGKTRDELETALVHGNIGVTTNQQMLRDEISLRAELDLSDIIIGLFEEEFLVQCYS